MKNLLPLSISLLILFGCQTETNVSEKYISKIFEQQYSYKMISSGDNFPDFNVRKDSLSQFLIALHLGIDKNEFQQFAGWTDDRLYENIEFLKSKNWLIEEDGLKPTIFIATASVGNKLYEYGEIISEGIADKIEFSLSDVKNMYDSLSFATDNTFEELSFFLISDVLLDNWQINNVENEFLKTSERPVRHGKNYYYAIMQNEQYPREQFGIYGNQYSSFNDSVMLITYGNNREKLHQRLKEDAFRDSLSNVAPTFTLEDQRLLDQMAEQFKPQLLTLLESERTHCKEIYHRTGYVHSITFDEFFIWWYHFIYTRTTDILAERGILSIPKEGNYYVFMEK